MPAHPTGGAVCEVEVDPETGAVEISRYASVDDAGQPINPLILHGQVHGGIAQGSARRLRRRRLGRRGPGAHRSFMDYAVPRADTVPSFDVALPKIRPAAIRCASRAAARPASRRRSRP